MPGSSNASQPSSKFSIFRSFSGLSAVCFLPPRVLTVATPCCVPQYKGQTGLVPCVRLRPVPTVQCGHLRPAIRASPLVCYFSENSWISSLCSHLVASAGALWPNCSLKGRGPPLGQVSTSTLPSPTSGLWGLGTLKLLRMSESGVGKVGLGSVPKVTRAS